jgi:hypothetical protein
MRKLAMMLMLCFLGLFFTVDAFAQVYVVCTQRVVVGVTRDGMKVYGNRCSPPVLSDMQQNIPSNCRWFQTLDQAYQWMNQTCDQ